MAVEIFLPKMSDHMESGEIAEWLVAEGERVEAGQIVVEIVTDKTTAEIEAPSSGILRGIRKGAEKGSVVPVGETIAFVTDEGEKAPDLPPLQAPDEKRKKEEEGAKRGAGKGDANDLPGGRISAGGDAPPGIRAAPAARRRARELGVDLKGIKGTGPGGIITVGDVEACGKS